MAGLGAAAQFGKIAVSLDAFRELYPVGEVRLGFLISSVGTAGLLFGVVGGIFISGFGIRKAMVTGLVGAALISAVQSMLMPYPVLIALRILEGATHLLIVVSGPILMARHSADHVRSAVMTLWSTFFGVSYMLIALIAPVIVDGFGAAGLLISHAGYMGALAVLLFLALPNPISSGVGSSNLKAAQGRFALLPVLRLHLSIYASPVTSAAALGFVFYTAIYISLLTYLPGFVDEARRSPMAASLPLVSIVVSLVIGIQLLRHFSPVRAVQIGYAVTGALALPLLTTVGNDTAFITSCLLLIGATGIIPGASFAALADLNRSDEGRAHGAGAVAQMGNVGTTCGPPLTAAIVSVSGVIGAVVFVCLCCCLGIVVHAVLERRRALYLPSKD